MTSGGAETGGIGVRSVLLVDDDSGVRHLLDRMLTELGYEVEAVGDGRSAEALLRERSFDAMITDYLLPDLVGNELAGRAKARWPQLRVIMISGLGPEVLGSAVDLLIEKPFRIDQLVDALGTPAVAAAP